MNNSCPGSRKSAWMRRGVNNNRFAKRRRVGNVESEPIRKRRFDFESRGTQCGRVNFHRCCTRQQRRWHHRSCDNFRRLASSRRWIFRRSSFVFRESILRQVVLTRLFFVFAVEIFISKKEKKISICTFNEINFESSLTIRLVSKFRGWWIFRFLIKKKKSYQNFPFSQVSSSFLNFRRIFKVSTCEIETRSSRRLN